jgi:hypothetical protein
MAAAAGAREQAQVRGGVDDFLPTHATKKFKAGAVPPPLEYQISWTAASCGKVFTGTDKLFWDESGAPYQLVGKLGGRCWPLPLAKFCGSWASAAGRQHMFHTLSFNPFVDPRPMREAWWTKNVTRDASRLCAICTTCGHICDSRLGNIVRGHGFGCFCNGSVAWSSDAGRAGCLALIEERNLDLDASQMTGEWWTANVTGCVSNLSVTCRKCGFVGNPRIDSFIQGRGLG